MSLVCGFTTNLTALKSLQPLLKNEWKFSSTFFISLIASCSYNFLLDASVFTWVTDSNKEEIEKEIDS